MIRLSCCTLAPCNLQLRSQAESEAIAQLEFAARQRQAAVEQEAGQLAAMTRMRHEVRPYQRCEL
jgi:hypothetical protein